MSLNSIKINTNEVIGVDEQPTTGSENLVKSGGIKKTYVKSENIVRKNIFNKNSTTRQNGVGQIYSGTIVYNVIFARVAVKILPNTTYYLNGLQPGSDAHLCFYNGETYISGAYLATDGQFTTPNNIDTVFITSIIPNFDTITIYDDEQNSYEPYGVQGEDIDFDSISKESINGKTIKEKTTELNILKGSLCNHFDKNNPNIELGYYLAYSSGAKYSQPTYCIVPIDLKPGFSYYVNGVYKDIHVSYFAGDYETGHYTGGYLITENTILNIPDGCDHIYFSVLITNLSSIMCSLGNEILEKYVPFGSYLDSKVLLKQSINKDKLNLGNTVLYHKRFDATADEEFIGDAYFDVNGLFVGQSTNFITFNRSYFIKPRTIRLLVTFTSGCSLTVKSNSGDSVANFNLSNNTFSCNTYSKSTTVFSNASDFYLIEIECDYNVGKIKVTNINTSETDELSATFSGKGGYGEGVVAEEIPGFGLWHEKYMFGIADVNYPCYIKEMSIVVPYQSCDMIVYGDSITEPEGYYPADDFSKSWTQLLKNDASYNILFSGRGGYGIYDVISTIKNELPYILPKYVMITIGTNGGAPEQDLRTLLDYIIQLGSMPILNNIPCNEHSTQVSVNSIIERIRQEYGISGCRFDNATSLAMDGIAVDTTKMYWEDYGGTLGSYYHHPNPKGAKAMITQLKIDIPHIF